jgi:hypothetical protein
VRRETMTMKNRVMMWTCAAAWMWSGCVPTTPGQAPEEDASSGDVGVDAGEDTGRIDVSSPDLGGVDVCVEGERCEEERVAAACERYCQNIYGSCLRETCAGLDATDRANLDASYDACLNGGTAQDGTVLNPCADDYLSDPQFAEQVDQFAAETCGESRALTSVYCGQFGLGWKCGCNGVTEPPEPVEPSECELDPDCECEVDEDCEGGTLNAICVPETDEDGEPTGPPGGRCLSGPCDAGSQMAGAGAIGPQTGCGEDGFCINEQTQNGVASVCYKQCSANTDCREGYACEVIGFFTNGDPAGRCQPACTTNEDCPVYTLDADPNTQLNSFCNTDGWCEIPCDPNEADSCGDSGRQACTARADFNADTDFTGSCELTP